MNRRRVLAMAALGVGALAGCIDDGSAPGSTGSSTDTPTPSPADVTPTPAHTDGEVTIPTPTGRCGSAAIPQSAQFVDEGGDDEFCFPGATPSLTIENERADELAMAIEIDADGERVLDADYELGPGKRAVEGQALSARGDHEAVVTVEGEAPVRGSWTGTSCFRHGISITTDGVAFGLVPPLSGPGDTQHDCYAGDPTSIVIRTGDAAQTVTVTVVDHCAGDVVERTVALDANEGDQLRDAIVNGGVYDVVFDVEDGTSATFSFDDMCWGIWAHVDEDGAVEAHQIPID